MAIIPGIRTEMGGGSYEIPPLSFAAVKRFSQDGTFALVDAIDADPLEKLGAIARVIHAALVRNYPETTLEQVEEMLDERSAPAAVMAIRGVTFKPREEAKQGEQ